MRKLICFVCGLFFSTILFSQQNFQKGYVLLNSNDSITGEIDYRNWSKNPDKITFRSNGKDIQYTVNTIKAFGVYDEGGYKTATITYYLSAADLRDAKAWYGDQKETSTVFLRILYSGEISLLGYNNGKREYIFLQKPDGEITELVYRVRVVDGVLKKDETYKSQLSQVLPMENTSFPEKISQLNYTEEEIVGLFTPITKPQDSFKKERAKLVKNIGIGAGPVFFKSSVPNFSVNTGVKMSAGFGITFLSGKNLNHSMGHAGINMNYITIPATITSNSGSRKINNHLLTTELILGGGYTINPIQKIKHTLFAEAGYNFVLDENLEISGRSAKGGFANVSLIYFVSLNKFRVGARFGIMTDLLDSAIPGYGLTANQAGILFHILL